MKGRPFLGTISGFFFGLFGGLTLFLFGAIPLDSHLLWILPIAGIVLGLFMATWAPFGKGGPEPAPAPQTSDDPIVDATPQGEPTEPPAE